MVLQSSGEIRSKGEVVATGHSDPEWRQVDRRLREYARHRSALDAAEAFARDHHRCTAPGCRSARNLDVHHIIEQSCGGPHELWNVTLLCSGHHAALHAGLLTLRGQAPYDLEFRWVYGPPIAAGLSPDARSAAIKQQLEEIFEQTLRPRRVELAVDGEAGTPPCPRWDETVPEAAAVLRGAEG
jgi:5-methylcytosine-specific restriction endonuclease McrA